jgi:hypothetical protein
MRLLKKLFESLYDFLKPKYSKKGAIETETIIKWAIILIVLAVLIVATTVLFKDKSGRLIESLKDLLKFGGS